MNYTKDGYKEIKDIKVGDKVYSENPETGEKGLKRVLNVFVKDIKELIHLKVGEQEIKTTANHPFWVEGIGWVDAGDLKPSDRLVMYSGEILEVKEAFVEYLDKPIKVYNFEVEDWHTYFVSEYNVFVHNAGCGGSSKNGKYAPKRELPRTKHGDPIPDTDVPHTQLGQRTDNGNTYNQARTWETNPNGKGVTAKMDYDFSDHGMPLNHPNPHQHPLTPANLKLAPKGGYHRGPAETLQ